MTLTEAQVLLIGQPVIYKPTKEWITVQDDSPGTNPLHRRSYIQRNPAPFKIPTVEDFNEHYGTVEEPTGDV